MRNLLSQSQWLRLVQSPFKTRPSRKPLEPAAVLLTPLPGRVLQTDGQNGGTND